MATGKPSLEKNYGKRSENLDKKSVEPFVELKDKMMEQIGIPDQSDLKYSLYKLSAELGNLQSINTIQKERSKNLAVKTLNSLKDTFREQVPKHLLNPDGGHLVFGRKNIEGVRKIKTSDLEKWRTSACEYLKKIERLETPLNMLREIELQPQTKKLLAKYDKTKVYELLEPGLEIEEADLNDLAYDIGGSFEYRNRKIKEFVAYRYARSAPLEMNIGEFALNVHGIIQDEQEKNVYRKEFLKNSSGFNAPVPPHFVRYGMWKLNESIDNIKPSDDKESAQKESLKSYILFEMIHPFTDGNGRTGRALFAYLQRRFSDKKSSIEAPAHIPIARYESGTIYPQEVTDGEHRENMLGSVSLDVNTLSSRILQREDMVALNKKLPSSFELDENKFNEEELKKMFDDFFDGVLEVLGSQEVESELDRLIGVIDKQSSLDDMASPDWNMVYDSAKANL